MTGRLPQGASVTLSNTMIRTIVIAAVAALSMVVQVGAEPPPEEPPIPIDQITEFPISYKFETQCISHNGLPELHAAILVWQSWTNGAIYNCGFEEDPDIFAEIDPDWIHRGSASAAQDPFTGFTSWCRIIGRNANDTAMWLHEVGHCLGHWFHVTSPPRSIMEPDGGPQILTVYDRDWVIELYGAAPPPPPPPPPPPDPPLLVVRGFVPLAARD